MQFKKLIFKSEYCVLKASAKMQMWFSMWILMGYIDVVIPDPTNIGAIFQGEDRWLEASFLVAVDTVNERRAETDRELAALVKRVPAESALDAEIAACELFKEKVAAVWGPASPTSASHVQSVCDAVEIPHLVSFMDEHQARNWSVVNLHPHPTVYADVLFDLVSAKGWLKFAIIYETVEGLARIKKLYDLVQDEIIYTISIYQLLPTAGNNYRPVLHKIKKSGDTNYILDCPADLLDTVLKQAQQVGLLSDMHSYIIVTPDMHTVDMEPYQHGEANIAGLRFIDVHDNEVLIFVDKFNLKYEEITETTLTDEDKLTADNMILEIALVYDSVLMYAEGLKDLDATFETEELECAKGDSWSHGSSVINVLRVKHTSGLTRRISFNDEGLRTDLQIDIDELTMDGLGKIGSWNRSMGLVFERQPSPPHNITIDDILENKTFIVLTALSAPYGMLKDSAVPLEGNERFEGFGIELIDELAKMLGFNYTFEIQKDGAYGSLNKQTNTWSGMTRKIMDGDADFAITDLTITADRESAVDFTSPFMNLGISILFKKPYKLPPSLFSFVSPFSQEVWFYLGGVYVGVSTLLFILGRICPNEWQNPYPCIEEPEYLENQFSLANSFWFTLGSIMTQGSEIAPIAMGTRVVGSIWFFFALIMVSSYTANLAAFLTVENKVSEINNAEELAKQTAIAYGAKRGGSTLGFFKESDNPIYQEMYEYMSTHPEVLTSSNDEGVNRVKNENYAYLMESTSIEYTAERECEVTQVGGLIDNKGYGIAMKKNSPYRNKMSGAVLQLQERGTLTRMKDKWWKEKRGGGACSGDEEAGGGATPLALANVGGVFIVLVTGSSLAAVCAFIEMLIKTWAVSLKYKVSFRTELVEELKFLVRGAGNTKPVRAHTTPPSTRSASPASHRTVHSRHSVHSRRSHSVKLSQMRRFS